MVFERIRTWLDGLIISPGKPGVKTALPLYEIMINMPDIAGDNPYNRLITAIELLEDIEKEEIMCSAENISQQKPYDRFYSTMYIITYIICALFLPSICWTHLFCRIHGGESDKQTLKITASKKCRLCWKERSTIVLLVVN